MYIIATSFCESKEWQNVVDAVEASRGIYEKRWDGQDLFPGMTALLLRRSQIYCTAHLRVGHQGEPLPEP